MQGVMAPSMGIRPLKSERSGGMFTVPSYQIHHANPLARDLIFYKENPEAAGRDIHESPLFKNYSDLDPKKWFPKITIALRFYSKAPNVTAYESLGLLTYGSSSGDNWAFGFQGGEGGLSRLFFIARLNSYAIFYILDLTAETNYNLAITYDGNTAKCFRNGSQIWSGALSQPDINRNAKSSFRSQRNSSSEITDLATWGRDLSPAELYSYFANPKQLHLNW